MAKILSPVWSIIRGSIAGTTYLANQYGQIIARQRTAAVQPGTTWQNRLRTAFSAAEAQWRLATDAQREDWALYAKTVAHPGPMGSYTLDARAQFLSCLTLPGYLNATWGESIPVSPAAPVGTGWLLISNISTAALPSTGTGFSFNVTNDEEHAIVCHLRISGPKDPTRNFWKGPWATSQTAILSIAASASGSHDFTGLIADKVYFVSIRAVSDSAEHRISEQFIQRAVAEVTV